MRDKASFEELSTLFFSVRQVVRANLPEAQSDPNAWLHFETMKFIASSEAPTMREVAAHLRITAPSATSLVNHLVARKFVRQTVCATDKRIKRLSLTTLGKRRLSEHCARSTEALRRVFSRVPHGELEALARALRRVRAVHSSDGQ